MRAAMRGTEFIRGLRLTDFSGFAEQGPQPAYQQRRPGGVTGDAGVEASRFPDEVGAALFQLLTPAVPANHRDSRF